MTLEGISWAKLPALCLTCSGGTKDVLSHTPLTLEDGQGVHPVHGLFRALQTPKHCWVHPQHPLGEVWLRKPDGQGGRWGRESTLIRALSWNWIQHLWQEPTSQTPDWGRVFLGQACCIPLEPQGPRLGSWLDKVPMPSLASVLGSSEACVTIDADPWLKRCSRENQ